MKGFNYFKDVDYKSVIVLGCEEFDSKNGTHCYVISVKSKYKYENVFVNEKVYEYIVDNGVGLYQVYRNAKGGIVEVEYIDTIDSVLK